MSPDLLVQVLHMPVTTEIVGVRWVAWPTPGGIIEILVDDPTLPEADEPPRLDPTITHTHESWAWEWNAP